MCLAAGAEKSNILIKDLNIEHLKTVINTFKQAGLNILYEERNLRIIKNKKLDNLKIIADDYPLFPTDLQQLMVSTLLSSNNISIVKDNIYSNRYSEVFELLSMNATLYLKNQSYRGKNYHFY